MKILLFILVAISIAACGNAPKTKTTAEEQPVAQKDRVEVLYFHGKQRCITCNAIEKLSKEVVDSIFMEQIKQGKVVYRTIDISLKENEEIANKYEVTWSSLFINKWKEGQETPVNMTDFAFTYAKGAPEQFKEGVKNKINEQLK